MHLTWKTGEPSEIAHEYKAETILEIFERVLELTPSLLAYTKMMQSGVN